MSGGDWHLRVSSIKQMAATFAAFDHPQTIISQNKVGEQLIPFPLAMPDHNGNPLKGQKSYMPKSSTHTNVFLQEFPPHGNLNVS